MLLYFVLSSAPKTSPSNFESFSVADNGVADGLQFFIPTRSSISRAYFS